MSSTTLITPSIKIQIGDYILTEGLEIECTSSKDSHCDWCSVKLSAKYEDSITYSDMDAATLYLGYEEDDYEQLITGYIRKTSDDYWRELIIKDGIIKLQRTYITASFVDAEPVDIIKYGLGQAGITNYKLTEDTLDKKKLFSVVNKNVVDTFTAMQSYWGLDYAFFFQNGCFYWGTKETQSLMYVLEYGVSIIKMTKLGQLWEIETVGIPWIHHSQVIKVMHPKYSGEVEVEKTILKSDENGFVRMYIYFRG